MEDDKGCGAWTTGTGIGVFCVADGGCWSFTGPDIGLLRCCRCLDVFGDR
jgi:hypothetical protein